MKKVWVLGIALAMAGTASAAPNVTNATQKGSLLIFPDIRVDAPLNTLIRIENDGSLDVDVLCYWMDGNKNRVDFIIPITKNQAVWFDARTGNGTHKVNPFPNGPANGFENPFLPAPDGPAPYFKGLLACWAVDGGAQNQVKWNHLSGTATVYAVGDGSYEYNAYAFFVPTGLDQEPVGVAGALNLNGVEYDSCPLYMISQFTPLNAPALPNRPAITGTRWAFAGCTLNLNQDWVPVFTKIQFDMWNEEEVKFTGAFDCADSWHELRDIDSAAQNFVFPVLGTFAARLRLQGVKSTQCEDPTAKPPIVTQAVGLLAVQSSTIAGNPTPDVIGSTLAAAGKFTGKVAWDPEGAVPEGGIR